MFYFVLFQCCNLPLLTAARIKTLLFFHYSWYGTRNNVALHFSSALPRQSISLQQFTYLFFQIESLSHFSFSEIEGPAVCVSTFNEPNGTNRKLLIVMVLEVFFFCGLVSSARRM